MANPIVHVEFAAKDPQQASQFYNSLFGWEFQEFPELNYTTFRAGDGLGGGINSISEHNPAGLVTFYVGTDDIDGMLKKAESMGAKVVFPKDEVPGQGWLAIFEDPSGTKVGLWTPAPGQG